MSELKIDYDKIKFEVICEKYKIKEISIFGSVLRDDFNPDSDVDILIDFLPGARITLFKYQQLREELEALFNRKVDLVSKTELIASTNGYRKSGILSNTRLLYGS